ncbi:unnamed protein product (macronuclear) [Paramecium tetraurelia]|uniref:RING-CH-type domain-containing protein n=1 Tax=Paramecium tetraurelia TaxID=5888 RepID=A0C7C3_PARTE|nr:uncharacterized protein GSPATT00035820001 [Paramecium tetraurelia]CAK66690.1 unnamed protein product [Paramecium tetraurelia]|eukprot:XP_001434087.1 hypothetical protein (macronuclear) [Paramecium tetraurelia strain d4-2]
MNKTENVFKQEKIQISESQVAPLDIISIIQQKYTRKANECNDCKTQHYLLEIIINEIPESSKIIDSTLQKQDSQQQLIFQKDIYARNSFKSVGCICRICEFSEYKENPLIRVCKCIRSQKYVHEYCLKKLIMKKYRNKLNQAKCEICSDTYQMELQIEKIFAPKIAWSQSKDKLPLFCLLVFLIVMIVVVILLGIRLSEANQITDRKNFLDSKSFLILFVIFSVIIILILLWLIAMIVKGLLIVEKIILWKLIEFKPVKKSILNKNILISDLKQSFRKSKLCTEQETMQNRTSRHQNTFNIQKQNHNQEDQYIDVGEISTQRNQLKQVAGNVLTIQTDPRSTKRSRFSII